MGEIKLSGYVPGAIGWVTELHGTYYAQRWDLGVFFEALVAAEMAEFFRRFDETRDGFWVALDDKEIVGSIGVDSSDAEGQGARLCWFGVAPIHHGRGIGDLLIDAAMDFCRSVGFQRVYLTTFECMETAQQMYARAGFQQIEERDTTRLGRTMLEKVLVCELTYNERQV